MYHELGVHVVGNLLSDEESHLDHALGVESGEGAENFAGTMVNSVISLA